MSDKEMLCAELQDTWHKEIPLSKEMGLVVESFDNNVLVTRASLGPNINVHGTAFAGSLYSVQALTGWGMIWLQLKLAGIEASMVLASGHIDYIKPVKSDLVTTCDFSTHSDALEVLVKNGKARIGLESEVAGEGDVACRFTGDFAVWLL